MDGKKTLTYVTLAVILISAMFMAAREALLAIDLATLSEPVLGIAQTLITAFTWGPVVVLSAYFFGFFGYLRNYFKQQAKDNPDIKYNLNKSLETIMYYLEAVAPFLIVLSSPPLSTLYPQASAIGAAVAASIATVIKIIKSQKKDLLEESA